MSKRVLAIVEGHTEFSVLNGVVAAHLGNLGVYFYPKIVGRPGHKGGVYRRFDSVAKEIVNFFKQEPTAVVTTFFDFYAMPEDWPGVADAKVAKRNRSAKTDLGKIAELSKIAEIVEQAWAEVIVELASILPTRAQFVPYVQMHELEALLYAGPKEMAEAFAKSDLEQDFANTVEECGGCEEINDHPQLAPSKRIEDAFPGYRKGRDKNKQEDRRPHAPIITQQIGISRIREACPHFSNWLWKLESLGY